MKPHRNSDCGYWCWVAPVARCVDCRSYAVCQRFTIFWHFLALDLNFRFEDFCIPQLLRFFFFFCYMFPMWDRDFNEELWKNILVYNHMLLRSPKAHYVDTDVHMNSPCLIRCCACMSCCSLWYQTTGCSRECTSHLICLTSPGNVFWFCANRKTKPDVSWLIALAEQIHCSWIGQSPSRTCLQAWCTSQCAECQVNVQQLFIFAT